jgi:hypothetical protein
VVAFRGEAEQAARLFGAAEALREAILARLSPASRAAYERHVAAARAGLEAARFVDAWAAGRALPPEDAAAEAMRCATLCAEQTRGQSVPPLVQESGHAN